jgi:putative DNA primase/helicase
MSNSNSILAPVNGHNGSSSDALPVAFFNHVKDNKPKSEHMTRAQISDLLTTHSIQAKVMYDAEGKVAKAGRLISPVIYPPGTTRANKNVEAVYLLILDFDNGVTLADIRRAADGYNSIIYTTHQHRLDGDQERYRLVIYLSKPVAGTNWPNFWLRAATAFGANTADKSAKDAARIYFLPACFEANKEHAHAEVLTGRDLDPDELPELASTVESETPPSAARESPIQFDKDSYDQAVRRWVLRAVEGEVQKMKAVGEGQRHARRRDSARALAGLIHTGHITESDIMDALSVNFGSDKAKALQTIRDGIKMGKEAPRTIPPLALGTSQSAVEFDQTLQSEKKNNADLMPAPSEEVGLVKRLADAILATADIAKDAGEKPYIFKDGTYLDTGEAFIKQQVKRLLLEWGLSKKWSSNRANEVVKFILVDAPRLWDKPPADTVNLRNGLLNVFTRELRPHSPEFLSTVQIPVTFDPKAECPFWEQFVANTFPDDAYAIAWEIAAWLITPDTSIQKSILALGEGSNGKSTWLTALSAFIGKRNIANLSLQTMESNRFAVARMVGKLANICPDLPSAHLQDTGIFKAVTGGDPIQAEYKYGEQFDVLPFARLVFSANQAPRSSDATHAFFRRWLVIPFNRTFEGKEVVSRDVLDRQLSDPRELSGVLNKALEALPLIRKRGFTESDSMKEAWNELRQTTDPLAVWLDTSTVEDFEPHSFVSKRALCAAYNQANKDTGRAYMSENAFGRALRRHRPNLTDGQRNWNGNPKEWVWLGLVLRS